MKVLFIGEGNHDIGPAGETWGQPRPARGVVPVLSNQVCPSIQLDGSSIALAWRDIVRFSPNARKGLEAKVAAAIVMSSKRLGCAGTVCVHDQDGDAERLGAMRRGKENGLAAIGGHHAAAVGIAIESIQAWTLGAPEAIAEELDVPLSSIKAALPKKHVEALQESSGKEEHQPKVLIARLAALAHREDATSLRMAIASRTNVDALRRACPQGFARFAEELESAFQP